MRKLLLFKVRSFNVVLSIATAIMALFALQSVQAQSQLVQNLQTTDITQTTARFCYDIHLNGELVVAHRVEISTNSNMNSSAFSAFGAVVNTGGWNNRCIDFTGLQANTQYYWRAETRDGDQNIVRSPILSFTTLGTPSLPEISDINTGDITYSSARVYYKLTPNNAATTSVIKYGLAEAALTDEVSGFSTGASGVVSSFTELNGLTNNTVYFYQIEATNSEGTTTSAIQTFTTLEAPVLEVIAEYNFDNTLNNVNGNTPFTASGNSFTADRHSNALGALRLANVSTVSISNLPVGNSSRTISLWVKRTGGTSNSPSLFYYGSLVTNQRFGVYFTSGGGLVFQAYANDQILTGLTIAQNSWYHFVVSYNGTHVTTYLNGELTHNFARPLNTGTSVFTLGNVQGDFDDLKIYNYALTDAEVEDLYNVENQPVVGINESKNGALSIYPNPAASFVTLENIPAESNITVFDVAGKVVYTAVSTEISTQIETNEFTNGVYHIQISHSIAGIVTKKLIISK